MSKNLFALLMSGIVLFPPGALGDESVVFRKYDWKERFLPVTQPSVPWLNLDTRTKLPKGDYPVGREDGIGRLVLQPVPNVRTTFHEQERDERM